MLVIRAARMLDGESATVVPDPVVLVDGGRVVGVQRNGQICRVGDRKGRLAAGFDADMLAVSGNPLDDPAALQKVRAVFRAGQRVTEGAHHAN